MDNIFDTLQYVFDSDTPGNPSTVLPSIGAGSELGQFGAMLVNIFVGLAWGFSFIALALSMVMFITSGGNPDKTKKAWTAFTASIISALVALLTIAIRRIFFTALGVTEPGLVDGLPDFLNE